MAYKATVENQKIVTMQCLRLDQAGEEIGEHIKNYAQKIGLSLEYFPVYASQSNESSERLVQELWKMVRTFTFESKLDLKIWGDAISHANQLRNILPAG